MLSVALLAMTFAPAAIPAPAPTTAGWHADYDSAARQAVAEKKDLVVYFQKKGELDGVFEDEGVRGLLAKFACLRVSADYQLEGKRLLDHPVFSEMMGSPGLAVVCFRDPNAPQYREAISVHPFVSSRYSWAPSYGVEEVKTILNLPDGTLSQRSMIYAVSVHPERPRSILAKCHRAFLGHAERHSRVQASQARQHHANIIAASYQLSSETGEGAGNASEVVAESWGNFVGGENVLEASFSCVDAWRHSPGHWGAVSRMHRFCGYDIARGANGTWYATGIFAD